LKEIEMVITRKFFSIFAISLFTLLLAYCGSGSMMTTPTGQPPVIANPEFAFVANTNSSTVASFEIDSSGMMFQVGNSSTGAAPEFMATDSSGKFLFVANTASNNVSAFQIDSTTGKLASVAGSPFAAGPQPEGVALVSGANLLFVANNMGNSISAFHFDPASGALSAVQGSPFTGVAAPFGAAADITGKFLFVTNLNTNTVSVFSIDSIAGSLSAVMGSPFPTGSTPIGLATDPMGSFVYVGDHMSDTVSPFGVDPIRGSLTPVTPLPALNQNCSSTCHTNPLRVAIHPTARLAFVADVGANSLSSFSISNGVLTPASGPIPTGQHPFGVTADPSGKFVYVVNKLDNDIAAFSVDTMTGALTPLANSPFPSGGSEPVGIVIVRPQ
jgi:6-phosphogluconolactonase (cycloisomerase 2 family)